MLAVLQAPHWIFLAVNFLYSNIIVVLLRWIIYAIMAVIYAILYVFSLVAWLMSRIWPLGEAEMPEFGSGAFEAYEEVGEMVQGEPAVWVEVAAAIIFILVIVLIVFFILRRLIGRGVQAANNRLYTEIQETLNIKERKKRSGVFRPKDPRQAIRWYYRKYLAEGASRGIKRERGDTSLSIVQKFAPVFPEDESEKLRELYIKARYQYNRDVQKDDAQAVSDLWHTLKQERKKAD